MSEPGLYSLILWSRKPEAEAFKDWVCDVVLPTIRKTGAYFTKKAAASFQELAQTDPDAYIARLREAAELAERLRAENANELFTANVRKGIEA